MHAMDIVEKSPKAIFLVQSPLIMECADADDC
jgi:hypothetical protein